MRSPIVLGILGALIAALAIVGYWELTDDAEPGRPEGSESVDAPPDSDRPDPEEPETEQPGETGEEVDRPEVEGDFADAANHTREDSYYPSVGDPGVDSLHHALRLDWDPATSTLTGKDDLTFRATADAAEIRLALGEPLTVTASTLDGEPVGVRRDGIDLIVEAKVVADEVYVLHLAYAGTPEPVEAPATRSDFSTLGFTIEDDGSVWTMQEPYGAFTWYPVNDQPADKARYDFKITAPSPMVGVANGELRSRKERRGRTVTRWHADAPMSSYLTTIAIADYDFAEDTTSSGTPVTYWALADSPGVMEKLRVSKSAIEWAEERLGPFPFDTAGIVHTASESGMETQTMVTIGDTDYALSAPVLVHEFIHQWYGDLVSPTDWRDVWMNEGMTMYLQAVYESETGGDALEATIDQWYELDPAMRADAGPPGAYKRGRFGDGNIYYIPAVMWHELREQIGDDTFWEMVRAWPSAYAESGATREEYFAWVEEQTGEELSDFFDEWLIGRTTPDRD